MTVDRAFTPPPTHEPVVLLEEQGHQERFTLPAAGQLGTCLTSFAAAVRAEGAASAREADHRHDAVAAMELADEIRRKAVRVTVGQ
ncbi:hypothetical protein [Streptomyces sp. TRM68367]|uniref:hypothetical protein n=1 Tax=Streptomyces sp. TRM68367 TaxID=2758415 RepID=UPI0021D15689|nr:hypothetical protein [Streptomyces sp. TRM68367]